MMHGNTKLKYCLKVKVKEVNSYERNVITGIGYSIVYYFLSNFKLTITKISPITGLNRPKGFQEI